MVRSYFNIQSAERLIPSLSLLVLRAQELKQEIEMIPKERSIMTDGEEELEFYDGEVSGVREEFYNLVEELSGLGVVLRDLDLGLIGFYNQFQGRDVFLSWSLGEKRIKFWQELDDEPTMRHLIIEFE